MAGLDEVIPVHNDWSKVTSIVNKGIRRLAGPISRAPLGNPTPPPPRGGTAHFGNHCLVPTLEIPRPFPPTKESV
jgi:hypothetical protein